jgi:hypothetical protein
MVGILSCQVHGTLGETYWAYVPDPSIAHPASWNNTGIKIFTKNITFLGGSESSHSPHQWDFLNYSADLTHHPCACLGMMALPA